MELTKIENLNVYDDFSLYNDNISNRKMFIDEITKFEEKTRNNLIVYMNKINNNINVHYDNLSSLFSEFKIYIDKLYKHYNSGLITFDKFNDELSLFKFKYLEKINGSEKNIIIIHNQDLWSNLDYTDHINHKLISKIDNDSVCTSEYYLTISFIYNNSKVFTDNYYLIYENNIIQLNIEHYKKMVSYVDILIDQINNESLIKNIYYYFKKLII